MPSRDELPELTRKVFEIAERDPDRAEDELDRLSEADQIALLCETPVAQRARLLELVPEPERLVPGLPEAELCFTVKALGLSDAGWILEHASDEQLQACVDLDAWAQHEPEPESLDDWLGSFADAGDETLLRAVHALDPELIMLWLRTRLAVEMKPNDDPGWQPPEGGRTHEGVFYLVAHDPEDDLAVPFQLLGLLFQRDYWFYFRLLQAVINELESDNQEWALRWRAGRLQDLGFPTWEEAMAIYGHLKEHELEVLPDTAPPMGEWHLPVYVPELPAGADARHLLFRAAAELQGEERRSFFYAFVALANKVAVADRLALGDAESMPRAIEKAAEFASRGLAYLVERHGLAPAQVLRRAPLDRLFRVGSQLGDA